MYIIYCVVGGDGGGGSSSSNDAWNYQQNCTMQINEQGRPRSVHAVRQCSVYKQSLSTVLDASLFGCHARQGLERGSVGGR